MMGDTVTVDYGRWQGRVGTLVRYDLNPGGMKQQSQSYPVVDLAAAGRARARRVRVLSVTPMNAGQPPLQ